MENMNIIIGIVSVVLSALTLLVMVFGFQLGKKAMFKSETLYGEEAQTRYDAIKGKLPADRLYIDGKYESGNKITPQFEVERSNYNEQTMPPDWKGITKTVRYYYKGTNGETMVKGWRLN